MDDIKREIEALIRCHGDKGGNLGWFAWYFDQGLMIWDEAQRQLELFARHIIPEFWRLRLMLRAFERATIDINCSFGN